MADNIKIIKCKTPTCKHEWQDTKYGKGQRVMNGTKDNSYRCTVCGTKQ